MDLTGQTLNTQFHVTRKLGQGGMGQVYLARQVGVERDVVVKVMHPELTAGSPQASERFRREAQAVARLNHPNIVQLYVFGETEQNLLYLALEYVEGESLSQLLARVGRLPVPRALRIIDQVCSALIHAHGHDLIHRDLKPDNIMLADRHGNQDYVKVLDFGIAKMMGPGDAKMTQTGSIFGTPPYMAPEQTSRHVDARADIYALGCVLYKVVTGALPFEADTPVGFLMKHATEPPPPPSQRFPELQIAPLVEAMILRCLEKQPGTRFQSVFDLQQEIRHALSALPTPVRGAPSPPVAFPQHTRTVADPAAGTKAASASSPSRRSLVVALSAVGVVAAAGIAWLTNQGLGDPPVSSSSQQTQKQALLPVDESTAPPAGESTARPSEQSSGRVDQTAPTIAVAKEQTTEAASARQATEARTATARQTTRAKQSNTRTQPAQPTTSTPPSSGVPASKILRGLTVPQDARLVSVAAQAMTVSSTLSRDALLRFYRYHGRNWGKLESHAQGIQIPDAQGPISFVSISEIPGGHYVTLMLTEKGAKLAAPKQVSAFGAPLPPAAKEYMRGADTALLHVPLELRRVMRFYRSQFKGRPEIKLSESGEGSQRTMFVDAREAKLGYDFISIQETPETMRAGNAASTQINVQRRKQ